MTAGYPGPAMIMALMLDSSRKEMSPAMIRPPVRPEDLVAKMNPTSSFPASSASGTVIEKDEIQKDVHDDDEERPRDQADRQVPGRLVDLPGDVGRRVPAGIGERDEEHRDGEGRAQDVVDGSSRQGERQMGRFSQGQAEPDHAEDEEDLEQGDDVLEPGAEHFVRGVDGGHGDDDRDGEERRRLDERERPGADAPGGARALRR